MIQLPFPEPMSDFQTVLNILSVFSPERLKDISIEWQETIERHPNDDVQKKALEILAALPKVQVPVAAQV